MKKLGILGVALALIAGVTLAAFRPAFAGTKRLDITGTLVAITTPTTTTAIPATPTVTTITISRTLSGTTTSYDFVVSASTRYEAKNGGKESLGVLTAGDTVRVMGTQVSTTTNTNGTVATVTTNTATKVTDQSIWRAKVQGVVANLDVEAKTFGLVISKRISELGVNATYTESNIGSAATKIQQTTITKTSTTKTVTTVNNKAWTDLANNQTVWTNGLWNSVSKTLRDSYITLPTITVK